MRRAAIALLVLTGCGAFNPQSSEPFSIVERSVTPTPEPDAGVLFHAMPDDVQLVGGGPSYVVASTASGPYRVIGSDAPIAMAYVDASGSAQAEPLTALVSREPAPPKSSAPVPATGLLGAGPKGLVLDFTDYLEPANVGGTSATGPALDDLGSGDSEVIWIGAAGGATRITRTGSKTFAISSESGAPSAVLEVDDHLALVAFEGRIYDLHFVAGQVGKLDYDFGSVHAMARGASTGEAFIASTHGLFHRTAAGSFEHLLSGVDVTGLAFDAINGAYLGTPDALLLLAPDGTLHQLGTLPPGAHPVAVDGFGDLWVGAGKQLIQFHVGTQIGYLNNVKPFLAANCFYCHVSPTPSTPAGTPRLALDDYDATRGLAQTIIQRLQGQGGVMPPAAPSGPGQLPASQYGVVIRWYRSGELP